MDQGVPVNLKQALKRALGIFSYIPSGSRAIFVYHDISPPGSKSHQKAHSTSPENFERQLKFLKEKFNFVPLSEILDSDSREPLATITFDDGFRSVLDFAHPVLRNLSIPYTIFLNRCAIETGTIPYPVGEWRAAPEDRVYLNSSDLLRLKNDRVSMGSHTMNHKILAHCNPEEEKEEIIENKRFLESLLGMNCEYLAAPFGKIHHISPRTLEIAQRAGHKRVFSTHPLMVNAYQFGDANFFVPRIPLLENENWEINFLLNRSLFLKI